MLSFEPFLNHLVPFFLVAARLAGLFVFTPLLANQGLPRRFRALLAVMFSAAVYPGLPAAVQMGLSPDMSLPALVPLLLAETLIGAAMGFIAGLPIISLDMAGVIMGHQMGMGLGRVYNPEMGADTDSLGQLLMYVGLASFVALGGLDAMFLAVVYTFDKVPIGSFAVGAPPVDAMVGVLTSGTELGLRVAAPVLCIIFLIMIAIGLLGKTMPQINIMSVGFTVKIFLGLAMLAFSMAAIQQVSSQEIERVLGMIVEWGRTMTVDGGVGGVGGGRPWLRSWVKELSSRPLAAGTKHGRKAASRSTDLSASIDLIGGVIILVLLGGFVVSGLAVLIRRTLEGQTPGDILSPDSIQPMLVQALIDGAVVGGPVLLAMFAIGAISHYVQVGWFVTLEPLKPNISRLNPAAGLKKFVNLRNIVRTGVSCIKLVVIGLIAALVVKKHLPAIAALPLLDAAPALYKILLLGLELAAWLLVLMFVIGIADFIYQRWQFTRDLRMTRQEVKDERRSVDGDPDVKARRLRMARDIAFQRLSHTVPKADVIVTNPTHFSVALKYDESSMRAPRVIAKGADDMAFRIRQIGIASGIPMVERPPLARGLYWGVRVGQEIKPEFYEAVAEVLAYVYRLKQKAA